MDLPINGQTVAWVREQLGGMFQIPPEATAFVDGERVSEDFVLAQGQLLEFSDETRTGDHPHALSESPGSE